MLDSEQKQTEFNWRLILECYFVTVQTEFKFYFAPLTHSFKIVRYKNVVFRYKDAAFHEYSFDFAGV